MIEIATNNEDGIKYIINLGYLIATLSPMYHNFNYVVLWSLVFFIKITLARASSQQ